MISPEAYTAVKMEKRMREIPRPPIKDLAPIVNLRKTKTSKKKVAFFMFLGLMLGVGVTAGAAVYFWSGPVNAAYFNGAKDAVLILNNNQSKLIVDTPNNKLTIAAQCQILKEEGVW